MQSETQTTKFLYRIIICNKIEPNPVAVMWAAVATGINTFAMCTFLKAP